MRERGITKSPNTACKSGDAGQSENSECVGLEGGTQGHGEETKRRMI